MTSNPQYPKPVTSATVASELNLGRKAVDKLIATGLIEITQTHGTTRFLDPGDLAKLKAYPLLSNRETDPLIGIAVSMTPMAEDEYEPNDRPFYGWTVPSQRPSNLSEDDRKKAYESWWAVGDTLATQVHGLHLFGTVSGFIEEVETVKDHDRHPEDPALIWFHTQPAEDEIRKRYLGHRVTFGRGAPWMRVRHS